jgi:drug/metabolite transporter (DMT)-like permease
MYAEIVALIGSFCTALSSVMATRGMKDSNPDTANLVLTGIQTIVLTVILSFNLPKMNVMAIIWFALAGVCGSFLGRLLTMMSYKNIGVSAGSAIIGTSPVVTTLLAVLFLGEPFSIPVLFGSIFVVTGIFFLNSRAEKLSFNKSFIYLPLGASLLYAVSNVIRKMGTNIQPDAVLGAQMSTMAGLVACVVYLAIKNRFKELQVNRNNINWLAGAGIVNAFAWITITMAINLGRVSVVTSIIYSYPLFSVLLSRIFLKDEPLNRNIIIGSLLIVFGVVIVSLLR